MNTDQTKRRIINIVNGRPDEHIPETVEFNQDQMVATVPEGHTKESVQTAINLLEKRVLSVDEIREKFAGGEIPAGTSYIVGEQPHGGYFELEPEFQAEIAAKTKELMNTGDLRQAEPKPFLIFKMVNHHGLDNNQIEPQFFNSSELVWKFIHAAKTNRGPRIVLAN